MPGDAAGAQWHTPCITTCAVGASELPATDPNIDTCPGHAKPRFIIMKRLTISLLLAVTLVAVTTPFVLAEEAEDYGIVDKTARQLYIELMSPYCPGLSLAACQSGAAAQLRVQIRERLAAGETKDEIVASLVDEFGEQILAAPKNEGFGRAAWLAPIVASLIGIAIVVVFLRDFMRRKQRQPAGPKEIDPAVRARVEKEIKELS